MNERKIHYLDHGATSWPKPDAVLEGISRFMGGVAANAGRSGHTASVDSARMVYRVRSGLAEILGVSNPEDIALTSGTTEGVNVVVNGFIGEGDRILVSPMEHNSVMRPIKKACDEIGAVCQILPADEFGRIDIESASLLAEKGPWKMIAISHASNVNGVVQDISGLRIAFPGVPILLDAAQTAGVLPIDVEALGVEFLACSGHKGLLGPTGIGGLYISSEHHLPPLFCGGTGSRSDSIEQPDFRPDIYESGTRNLHGIAGLEGSLNYLKENGLGGDHKRKLVGKLIDSLSEIDRITLHTPVDGKPLMVSISIEGMYPDEVSLALETEYGILCRPGLHCSPSAHEYLATSPNGTIRLSPGYGNTEEDIDAVIDALGKITVQT